VFARSFLDTTLLRGTFECITPFWGGDTWNKLCTVIAGEVLTPGLRHTALFLGALKLPTMSRSLGAFHCACCTDVIFTLGGIHTALPYIATV